jgi:ABC-2 type transport system permease protein
LQLLQSQTGKAPEQVLNSSIQDLEYNLASGIRKLVSSQRQRVAVLDAYGTPSDLLLWDALSALNEFYQVERINLNEKLSSLTERTFNEDSTRILFKNKYDAVLIIKPSQAFSERDKFILDQYLMRGGKLLWALDRTNADMDSLRASPETVGIARDLNLEDMLFRYGARINPDLLMDIRSMPIPVRTGEMGGQPQFEFYPWYYMPLLSASGNHPVVNNLNMIHSAFVSSVDSIEVAGIRKTALLLTSQYTRKVATPAYISLEILRSEPDQRMFADGVHTAALLLEGRFPSLFANRIPPEILESKEMGFLEESEPSRMIVIGDGDLFLNQISAGTRNPLPLGYDQYTGESFGNRDFLVNAVNYLTDESGLIQIRSREIRLRMLDRTRVAAEKPRWQLLNTAGPVLLVLLLSAAGAFLRKRRYGTKS